VWSCSAVHLGNSSFDATGWTKKDFIYELSTSQVNFTASSSSTSKEAAYTFTTSSPSPFWRKSSSSSNSADTGTYILYDGMLVTKNLGGINEAYPLSVEVVSDTRIILTALWKTNELSERIVCDSAEAVPASPTAPSVSLDAENKRLIVAWTDASDDELGFRVYRKLSSDTDYRLLTTLTGENSFADVNVTEGQTAYYQVVAYNDNGESAKSKTVSATLDYTAPTVVSTTPENNGTGSRQLRDVVVTFSEKVEIACPSGDQYTDMACPSSGYAISFTALIEGSSRSVGTKSITAGYGGSTTLSLTTMGSAERFDANQSGIKVTVNKDWIRDANGVQMAEDFQFDFNVDASLDNPSCPPSC
jgi:autonomous glycyl radical cofactor GrcA